VPHHSHLVRAQLFPLVAVLFDCGLIILVQVLFCLSGVFDLVIAFDEMYIVGSDLRKPTRLEQEQLGDGLIEFGGRRRFPRGRQGMSAANDIPGDVFLLTLCR
jgi:hypothetical protein